MSHDKSRACDRPSVILPDLMLIIANKCESVNKNRSCWVDCEVVRDWRCVTKTLAMLHCHWEVSQRHQADEMLLDVLSLALWSHIWFRLSDCGEWRSVYLTRVTIYWIVGEGTDSSWPSAQCFIGPRAEIEETEWIVNQLGWRGKINLKSREVSVTARKWRGEVRWEEE